jgi:hypothetical protein
MTPFEQYRLWLRRAPVGERVVSTIVGAVVLALVVFILIPVTSGGDDSSGGDVVSVETTTTIAGQPGDTTVTTAAGGGTPTGGVSTGSGSGSTSSGSGVGRVAVTGGNAPAGCTSPPGSDQGISNTEIHIAITITNIVGPAGNSTFGVPSVEEQKQDYQLAIDDVNKNGGVACRKLVADMTPVNPADSNNQQGTCLDIVGKKVFAEIDAGGYYGVAAANCYPQHQIPFFGTGRLTPEQRDQFYPYMFGTGDYASLYRNGMKAFDQMGFFSQQNGFKKLGWVYRDCWKSLLTEVRDLLHEVGLNDSQISTYNLGCPNGNFANPADIQQAILQFQGAGVTHVIESQAYQDFANFTTVAQRQNFKPKYAIPDDSIIPTTQGNLHVDYDNTEGALIVTSDRYGDESSGVAPNASTNRCDALSTAVGRPPTYKQPVGFGGVACNQIWMVKAAIEHSPSLQRKSLADGLHAAKSIETAYPRGPVDWSGARTTYGGQFWRVQTFQKACTCWKVTDATFHPGFP